jgi:VIT1/CCC1 family predicted Fe2+/Mn2+ transporter
LERERKEKHPHIRARDIIHRIVLGGTDGVIESVAVTAGLNGAGLAFSSIRLAGVAFAFAGAFSMFFSSYISERSEQEALRKDIDRERMEIETEPEEEKAELEQLLREEGYKDKEVATIMGRVTVDKELWLRVQLRLELHKNAGDVNVNPLRGAGPAGLLFFLGAALPILPYLFPLGRSVALLASLTLALVTLFLLGGTKFTTLKEIDVRAGLEDAAIGGFAAVLLFVIGHLISFV